MTLDLSKIERLVAPWESSDRTIFPVPVIFRFTNLELVHSLIPESKTLNELGLVDWALELFDIRQTEFIQIERGLIRRNRAELELCHDANGVPVGQNHRVPVELAVKGLILSIVFMDNHRRVCMSTALTRRSGILFKNNAEALAVSIRRHYLANVK